MSRAKPSTPLNHRSSRSELFQGNATCGSCLESPWARRAPELLPYEWFVKESAPQNGEKTPRKQALLILWLEEDAMSRSPLKGMERVIGLAGAPGRDGLSDGLRRSMRVGSPV
jgi:hypothetical protein